MSYTLRQFRANTKQAFDDASEGHEVVITRGKQSFQLVALVDKPLPGHNFESRPAQKPELKEELKKAYPKVPRAVDQCEHGAGPRLCVIKSCKNYQFRRK